MHFYKNYAIIPRIKFQKVRVKMTNADDTVFLPIAVTYLRASGTSGTAEGELIITPASAERLRGYNLYWGSESENKLANFTKIAAIESDGSREIRYQFPDGLLIPEGAAKLLLFPLIYFPNTKTFMKQTALFPWKLERNRSAPKKRSAVHLSW